MRVLYSCSYFVMKNLTLHVMPLRGPILLPLSFRFVLWQVGDILFYLFRLKKNSFRALG